MDVETVNRELAQDPAYIEWASDIGDIDAYLDAAYAEAKKEGIIVKSGCECGAIESPLTEREMTTAQRGERCPECHTFLSDHAYMGGADLRCWECDTRPHSHGRPPAKAA